MAASSSYDSVIVGSGPNGLAAAITLARAGRSVCVLEASDVPGGALRSDEGTLPGFIHDTCSAIFPMAVGTPFFSSFKPKDPGIEWITPPAAVAHPFDDGSCILVGRSMDETVAALGSDGPAYGRYMKGFPYSWKELSEDILMPALHVPRHPFLFTRFGVRALWPVYVTARTLFSTPKARAVFAGMGAHSIMPLEYPLTSAFALFMLSSAHATGWPIPSGGAAAIAGALAGYSRSLGAEIILSRQVTSLRDLPDCRDIMFDLSPAQVLAVAGDRIPLRRHASLRHFRHGPGAFKVDWALDGPIPWRSPDCCQAATLHLGGSFEEIVVSERQVWQGVHPERPFVLCAQPSLFDRTRAPDGRHTAWAYCHVPHGSGFDMTWRIEEQIERFAPGFRKRILSRRIIGPQGLEQIDANLVGGDIGGGANTIGQILFRPFLSSDPYSLGKGIFLCSASAPPGGGVHGMCGYNAAMRVLCSAS